MVFLHQTFLVNFLPEIFLRILNFFQGSLSAWDPGVLSTQIPSNLNMVNNLEIYTLPPPPLCKFVNISEKHERIKNVHIFKIVEMLDVCTSVIIVSLIGQIGEKAFDYLLHMQIVHLVRRCSFKTKIKRRVLLSRWL